MTDRLCKHREAYGWFKAKTQLQAMHRHGTPSARGLRVVRCKHCRAWYYTMRKPWWKKALRRLRRSAASSRPVPPSGRPPR